MIMIFGAREYERYHIRLVQTDVSVRRPSSAANVLGRKTTRVCFLVTSPISAKDNTLSQNHYLILQFNLPPLNLVAISRRATTAEMMCHSLAFHTKSVAKEQFNQAHNFIISHLIHLITILNHIKP